MADAPTRGELVELKEKMRAALTAAMHDYVALLRGVGAADAGREVVVKTIRAQSAKIEEGLCGVVRDAARFRQHQAAKTVCDTMRDQTRVVEDAIAEMRGARGRWEQETGVEGGEQPADPADASAVNSTAGTKRNAAVAAVDDDEHAPAEPPAKLPRRTQ